MSVFKTIKNAAGPRKYTIGALFSAVVASFDWVRAYLEGHGMEEFIGIPSWAAGIIVLLVFISYWFFSYAHRLRGQIEEGYKELAELRGRGVSIRNDGVMVFTDERALKNWEKQVSDWESDTIKALEGVNVAISIWFSRLDALPKHPRVGFDKNMSERQLKSLREHDRRLHNLGRLIRDLWGIGEVHEEDVAR